MLQSSFLTFVNVLQAVHVTAHCGELNNVPSLNQAPPTSIPPIIRCNNSLLLSCGFQLFFTFPNYLVTSLLLSLKKSPVFSVLPWLPCIKYMTEKQVFHLVLGNWSMMRGPDFEWDCDRNSLIRHRRKEDLLFFHIVPGTLAA